jgi:hypothetical protein
MEVNHVRTNLIAFFWGFRKLLFSRKAVWSDVLLFLVLDQLNFIYFIVALLNFFENLDEDFGVLNDSRIFECGFSIKNTILV